MTRWVVLDAVEQKMKCLRCGCTRPMDILTGKTLTDAVAIMDGLSRSIRTAKTAAVCKYLPRAPIFGYDGALM